MSEKIDARLVKGIARPAKGNIIVYDGGHQNAVVGFGIRATAGGAKSFILNYRVNKRERRYTIGAYPTWSVAAAREEAKELRKRIDRGEDPLGARRAKLDAPTVADLCDHYIEHYLPTKRPKGQREDQDMIDKWVRPTFGKRLVAEVRRADIAKLHRSLRDTPYRANRVLALLGKMFRIAMHEDLAWRGTNPAKKDQTGRDGIRPYEEEARKRYLSEDERRRLAEVLAEFPNQTIANAIRLLMLTGARRNEALSAIWSQFDLENGTWRKPSAHTKQRREHMVPLSAPVLHLLAGIKEESTSKYVFPQPGDTDEPLRNINNAWMRIRKAAKIEDVRLHDLRHSYASILASAGVSLPIIGQLLGHTQVETTQRYGHLQDDALREATKRVGEVIESSVQDAAEIILLRPRG